MIIVGLSAFYHDSSCCLLRNGKLIAAGTSVDPIYFSSISDDTLCGIGAFDELICDTHNDGTGIAPQEGDWGHIRFNADSDDNSLITRSVFRYSGNGSNGAIYLPNASPELSYITFTDNYINGVELEVDGGLSQI